MGCDACNQTALLAWSVRTCPSGVTSPGPRDPLRSPPRGDPHCVDQRAGAQAARGEEGDPRAGEPSPDGVRSHPSPPSHRHSHIATL